MLKEASLVEYIVHYVAQLLAKSSRNQSTAQNIKAEKLGKITLPSVSIE